jgi:hypothetical protein
MVAASLQRYEAGRGKATFSSKFFFQDFPSYRMFGHMHGALNIDKKTNYTVW